MVVEYVSQSQKQFLDFEDKLRDFVGGFHSCMQPSHIEVAICQPAWNFPTNLLIILYKT